MLQVHRAPHVRCSGEDCMDRTLDRRHPVEWKVSAGSRFAGRLRFPHHTSLATGRARRIDAAAQAQYNGVLQAVLPASRFLDRSRNVGSVGTRGWVAARYFALEDANGGGRSFRCDEKTFHRG
jgi:hypothetical protein